jgi:CRP-like cAMP-binding protein
MHEDMIPGDPFDDPLWKAAEKTARARRRRRRNRTHIGCPMWWLRAVLPLARSAEQLAVALYVYRLTIVRRSKTISVSNQSLKEDLGVGRFGKYKLFARLEEAGLWRIKRRNKHALEVTLLKR